MTQEISISGFWFAAWLFIATRGASWHSSLFQDSVPHELTQR